MAIVDLVKNTVFRNYPGTGGDSLYIDGKQIYGAWIKLWENLTGSTANLCSCEHCTFHATDGAHITLVHSSEQITEKNDTCLYILPPLPYMQ